MYKLMKEKYGRSYLYLNIAVMQVLDILYRSCRVFGARILLHSSRSTTLCLTRTHRYTTSDKSTDPYLSGILLLLVIYYNRCQSHSRMICIMMPSIVARKIKMVRSIVVSLIWQKRFQDSKSFANKICNLCEK